MEFSSESRVIRRIAVAWGILAGVLPILMALLFLVLFLTGRLAVLPQVIAVIAFLMPFSFGVFTLFAVKRFLAGERWTHSLFEIYTWATVGVEVAISLFALMIASMFGWNVEVLTFALGVFAFCALLSVPCYLALKALAWLRNRYPESEVQPGRRFRAKNPVTGFVGGFFFTLIVFVGIKQVFGSHHSPYLYEARSNISAIRTAEMSYNAEFGFFVPAPPWPPGRPGQEAVEWGDGEREGFLQIGWAPEGNVVCRYGVAVSESKQAFTVEAICDRDGDGKVETWGFMFPEPGQETGIRGPFGICPVTGVYNPSTGKHESLQTVGQCYKSDSVQQ